jgi:hypothetical protein
MSVISGWRFSAVLTYSVAEFEVKKLDISKIPAFSLTAVVVMAERGSFGCSHFIFPAHSSVRRLGLLLLNFGRAAFPT